MFSRNGRNLHFKRKLERLTEDDCELDSSLEEIESTRVRSKRLPPVVKAVPMAPCPPAPAVAAAADDDDSNRPPLGEDFDGYEKSIDGISR